eukprot:365225-Chlamydomonas_euryale.AAC.1
MRSMTSESSSPPALGAGRFNTRCTFAASLTWTRQTGFESQNLPKCSTAARAGFRRRQVLCQESGLAQGHGAATPTSPLSHQRKQKPITTTGIGRYISCVFKCLKSQVWARCVAALRGCVAALQVWTTESRIPYIRTTAVHPAISHT